MPATSLLPQRRRFPTNRSSAEINLDLCLAPDHSRQDILLHRLSGHAATDRSRRSFPNSHDRRTVGRLLGAPRCASLPYSIRHSGHVARRQYTHHHGGYFWEHNPSAPRHDLSSFGPSCLCGKSDSTDTFDPAAASLLDRYPQPTSSRTCEQFQKLGNEPDNQTSFDVRIDHRFTERDQFFARYSYFKILRTGNSTPRWKWRDRRGSGAGASGHSGAVACRELRSSVFCSSG